MSVVEWLQKIYNIVIGEEVSNMNIDSRLGEYDISKNNRNNRYSRTSFLLSAIPLTVLIIGFLFCLMVSGGSLSEADSGAVWLLFVFLICIIGPVAIITNILSVVFGIRGLKIKKTVFAWSGIAIVAIEVLAIFLLILGFVFTSVIPVNHRYFQWREEISNFETYTDLTPFGLGIYKLQNESDEYLWDITKPVPTIRVLNSGGVDMVYEHIDNIRDEETWDNCDINSNEGKDMVYDVLFYDGTYIIITPLKENYFRDYWGWVYLCKNIDKDIDLFRMGIEDPKVVEKLRELPREQISRKELAEKLGKIF